MTSKTAWNPQGTLAMACAMAVEYDNEVFEAFQLWKETENPIYKNIWLEKAERCNAMTDLLNRCDTFYTHYVFNGEVVRELIP